MYLTTLCRDLCKTAEPIDLRFFGFDPGLDSSGAKYAQVQLYSPGGANVPTREGTLAPLPPGEYD